MPSSFRPRSLRFALVAGLGLLQLSMMTAVAAAVYAHSSDQAAAAMRNDLEVRAKTLADVVEIDPKGIEIEITPRVVPEYQTAGSYAYAVVYDAEGKPVIRSPSLEDRPFASDREWAEGVTFHEELDEGPHGWPCSTVTLSFVVRVEEDADAVAAGWTPPTAEERRYQIRVGLASERRDGPLHQLALFLCAVVLGATLLTILAGLLLSNLLLRPIAEISAHAESLSLSRRGERVSPESFVLELQVLAEKLNEAYERAGAAFERERRFTAEASHELRTPVTVLLGSARLLLRRERTRAEYVEGLRTQVRVGEKLRSIVDALLFLARADAQVEALHRQPARLSELIRDVVGEFDDLCGPDGVRVTAVAGDEVEVSCDSGALARVLRNLIANAIHFSPVGGTVDVSMTTSETAIELRVSDSGRGIPPEYHDQVFERFFRVECGRDEREGSGLGLSIARAIMEAHGGSLAVESSSGSGTTFIACMPRDARPQRSSGPSRGRDSAVRATAR